MEFDPKEDSDKSPFRRQMDAFDDGSQGELWQETFAIKSKPDALTRNFYRIAQSMCGHGASLHTDHLDQQKIREMFSSIREGVNKSGLEWSSRTDQSFTFEPHRIGQCSILTKESSLIYGIIVELINTDGKFVATNRNLSDFVEIDSPAALAVFSYKNQQSSWHVPLISEHGIFEVNDRFYGKEACAPELLRETVAFGLSNFLNKGSNVIDPSELEFIQFRSDPKSHNEVHLYTRYNGDYYRGVSYVDESSRPSFIRISRVTKELFNRSRHFNQTSGI